MTKKTTANKTKTDNHIHEKPQRKIKMSYTNPYVFTQ